MNIAVVIPYYQKSAGVLTRSLKSVFAQTLANDVRLDVIIADDASPLDPAGDVAEAGTPPAGVSIRVVKRANGGPGAARNTALDAVAKDCDLIAFIDSDDEWTPDHLSRAIEALGDEGDFYFANHKRNDGHPSDLDRSRFLKLAGPEGDGFGGDGAQQNAGGAQEQQHPVRQKKGLGPNGSECGLRQLHMVLGLILIREMDQKTTRCGFRSGQ